MGLPFAKELVKLGHEVQVLTGFPNYPGGKLYTGYRIKLFQREDMEGIPVVRVPLYPSHDKSSIGRIANYLSFAFLAAAIGPWAVKSADVAYVYHPPATIYLPAFVIRLIRRIPLVYNIQDLWPDSLSVSGMFNNPFGLRVVNKWCEFIYRSADKIVVLSPGFKRTLCNRGVSADKIEVIYNPCDDTVIHPVKLDQQLKNKLGLSNHFNVMFAGNMGKVQALDAVLDAASIVQLKCSNIQFVFVGGGVEVNSLKQKANNMGLRNVRFIPRQPVSEIGAILRLADVLLVHLKDDPLFRITIPGKTQAYMAVGRPILMCVKGDAADLVKKAAAGLTCEPENPQSIADALCQLQAMPKNKLAAMGKNGRAFYEKELSLENVTKRYERIFKFIARKSE
jgi:colanic acid biosynthesis glycosyl transferase WcaI